MIASTNCELTAQAHPKRSHQNDMDTPNPKMDGAMRLI